MEVIFDAKFLLGVASNSTALYLVCKKSRRELSEYRKLLILFLVSDFIFTIVQEVLKPIAVVDGNLFLIYLTGERQSQLWLSMYCGLMAITFTIFAFHFMYRAYSISSDSLVPIKLNFRKLTMIVLIFAIEFIALALVCYVFLAYEPSYYAKLSSYFATQNRTLPNNIEHAFLILVSYTDDGRLRWDNLVGIVLLFSIIAIAAVIITVSSIHITKALMYVKTMSDQSKNLHTQLFIALLVQLSIPCILLYIPCSFYFISPFLLPDTVHTPPWLITTLYSWYPIIDPLAIIFMIADYRRAVVGWVKSTRLIPRHTETTMATATAHVESSF